jgi:hypothetical protein
MQGDQIGRIFAYWAVVSLRQFYENYRGGANFLGNFSHGTSYVLTLAKYGLGCILGDFFHKHIWSHWNTKERNRMR